MITIRKTSAALLATIFAATIATFGASCASNESATSDTDTATDATTRSSSIKVAGDRLFDSSMIHTVSVVFDQGDYDEMVAAYKSDKDKDWIEATVTIDGTTYEQVGMRLKGNSSLRGLANGRETGPGGAVSADEPQALPWLIRLDKYVEGQSHDGITDLVIRSNSWKTSLNEAVALELLESAGLASQRAAYVRFTVNDGDDALRLMIELPDDTWMAQNFSAEGALYKAEATGNYNYRGNDPAAYDEIFDQEAGKDNADLTPVIEFLDFVNNSDDYTFASRLSDWLDVDSLATYLAMQELIGNFDDMDGPGNNSYLYYDPGSGRFTVVAWDHNLAFGGWQNGGQAGGQAGGQQVRPGLRDPGAPGNAPGQLPVAPGADPNADGRGPRNKVNMLTQRFHANPEFEALYEQRLDELRADLYESGVAADALQRWTDLLESQASDLADASVVETEAAKISAYFEQK